MRRPSAVTTVAVSPSVSIDVTSTPVTSSAPRRSAAAASWRAHRAHPADRDVPVAGPATDDVVQEAPVGEQVGAVGGRERADQRVGQHDARGPCRRRARARRARRSAARTGRATPRRRRRGGACASRSRSGSVSVGNTRSATRAVIAYSSSQPAASAPSAASRRAGSASSTSTPPSPTGVYDDTSRRRSVTSRPSSSTICAGSRLTRYEYFDRCASRPGNTGADRTAPPSTPHCARARRPIGPAPARYAAQASPLWPPPTTTAS